MTRIILFFFAILFSVTHPPVALASDAIAAKHQFTTTSTSFSRDLQYKNLDTDPSFIEVEEREENENENFSFDKKANTNCTSCYIKFFDKDLHKQTEARLYIHQKRYLFLFLRVFRL